MDEKPDKIVQHIESKRNELGRNLDELQNKVRETTDWRNQFDKHPYILMGAAMGGGMLLSSMMGSSPSRSRGYSGGSSLRMPQTSSFSLNDASSASSAPFRESSSMGRFSGTSRDSFSGSAFQRQRAWSVFDNIKGALFGLAATKAQEYLNEMLPGFREHFQETEKHNRGFAGQGSQSWGQGPSNQPGFNPPSNPGMQQHHQPWDQGHREHMGETGPGRGFNQQERWSGQPETWRHSNEPGHNPGQGQWPQERSFDREREQDRDRERNPMGAFDTPPFRR